MALKKKPSRGTALFRTVAAVFIALMISAQLISGIYAKYSSGNDTDDDASIARFSVSSVLEGGGEELASFALTMIPGESKIYTVTVTNDSSVAVRYSVAVDNLTGNLPITIALDDKRQGEFPPSAAPSSKICTVTISWPTEQNGHSYAREVEHVQITVICEQID